jgi:hypothetical protein
VHTAIPTDAPTNRSQIRMTSPDEKTTIHRGRRNCRSPSGRCDCASMAIAGNAPQR